jgi:hypothetical protein
MKIEKAARMGASAHGSTNVLQAGWMAYGEKQGGGEELRMACALQIHVSLIFDELAAFENHFRPVSHAQLEKDPSQIGRDRVAADVQLIGDLPVYLPEGGPGDNLLLSIRQGLEQFQDFPVPLRQSIAVGFKDTVPIAADLQFTDGLRFNGAYAVSLSRGTGDAIAELADHIMLSGN